MELYALRKIGLLSVVLVFIIAMVFLFSFSQAGEEKDELLDSKPEKLSQHLTSPAIPSKVDFAGEAVPLSRAEVMESLDRELMVVAYFHSNSMLMMKRANRWFEVIEPILKENNIPDDFKYLALIESGLDNVKSPRGAAGFWQFLKKTAREYGLEVNDFIDERYNLQKATVAACAYFNDSYDEYKSWTLVAAAYNAGNRRISESIEKQKRNSYYKLYLNEETSRYVFRILAAKILLSHPEKYGFNLTKNDLYAPHNTRTVSIDTTVADLIDFSEKNGVSYKTLKSFNPWLRSDHLPDKSGRTYLILLPKK